MLSNILTNTSIQSLDEIENLLELYTIKSTIEDRLYMIDYHHNLDSFRSLLNGLLQDLKLHVDKFTEELLVDIFKAVCLRLEQVEIQLYDGIYTSDTTIENLLRDDSIQTVDTLAAEYVTALCRKYDSLSITLQREAKRFYMFKCDIIDFFTCNINTLSQVV